LLCERPCFQCEGGARSDWREGCVGLVVDSLTLCVVVLGWRTQKSVAEKVKEEKEKKGKERSQKTHGGEEAAGEVASAAEKTHGDGGGGGVEAWALGEEGGTGATEDGGGDDVGVVGDGGGGGVDWTKAMAKAEEKEQRLGQEEEDEEEVDWESRYNYASDGDGAKIYSTSKVPRCPRRAWKSSLCLVGEHVKEPKDTGKVDTFQHVSPTPHHVFCPHAWSGSCADLPCLTWTEIRSGASGPVAARFKPHSTPLHLLTRRRGPCVGV
jgi:hypothetical protein